MTTTSGDTPPSIAAENNLSSVFDFLVAHEYVRKNLERSGFRMSLCSAISCNRKNMVEALLALDSVSADFMSAGPSNRGQTPLSLAAFGGNAEIVKMLLGREEVRSGFFELDEEDLDLKSGKTMLESARSQHHYDIVELLEPFYEEKERRAQEANRSSRCEKS